ncbi:MAG: ATP-binding cassette domain-containing protein [Isosphaeraceae bacterium]
MDEKHLARLRLEQVGRRWPGGGSVENIGFEVGPGEILGLVGRTGVGKSTVLRLIAGLEGLDAGLITVDNKSINELRPHERRVSMIFQRPVFYPGRRLKSDIDEARRKGVLKRWEGLGIHLATTIDELQLTDQLLGQKPETFSGGEARRASIITALLQDRPILLADEPLNGLDPDMRERVSRFLWRFIRLTQKTMVVVLHEPADSMAMADRIAVLKSGRIVQQGRPEELLNQPKSLEVVKLLHFPPPNDVSGLRMASAAGQAAPMAGQLTLVPARFCRAEACDDSDEPRLITFFRQRWLAGEAWAEWHCPATGGVVWTPGMVSGTGKARLVWDQAREICLAE